MMIFWGKIKIRSAILCIRRKNTRFARFDFIMPEDLLPNMRILMASFLATAAYMAGRDTDLSGVSYPSEVARRNPFARAGYSSGISAYRDAE